MERKTLSGLRPEGVGQKRSQSSRDNGACGVFIEKSW